MALTGKQAIYFLILMTALYQQVISVDGCGGTCYTSPVWPEPDHTFNKKHLRGFSYMNLTAPDLKTCYAACSQDCRCKACQMQGERCELLDENKDSMLKYFVDAPGYTYYDMEQAITEMKSHLIPPNTCYNGCCQKQLCKNGGTCTEKCVSPEEKLTCKCRKGYYGKLCETTYASCMDVLKFNKLFPDDGVYWLVRDDKSKFTTFSVYCSFEENPTRAWTLIESFAFQNKDDFKLEPFYVRNYTVKYNEPQKWNHYRLGLKRTRYLRSKSTLFSATCDFPKRNGSLTSDLLIGRLSDVDITTFNTSYGECKKFMFIDVSGHSCEECTAYAVQNHGESRHFYIDVTLGYCDFNPNYGTFNSFGYYYTFDNVSKCTASPSSTTQWWLGEEQ